MGRLSKEEIERRESEAKANDFPTLEFSGFGWCEELKKSYSRGLYKPKSKEEYEALKPFSKK